MQELNQNILERKSNNHLAGIVPVSGNEVRLAQDNSFFLHPCLSRIGKNILAVERAIIECNYAGCETIWVVCNEDIQPIVRSRIGDYITCFASMTSARFSKFSKTKIKYIPVFYVSIPVTLRDKRDSLGWSILHGANQSFVVSAKISKWLTPNRYFVSFPYGIHDPVCISKYKKDILSGKNIFINSSGHSVSSGACTSFTFGPSDYKRIRDCVKKACTGSMQKPRWSSKNFSLDKFYNYDTIDNIIDIEVCEYHSIFSWDDYRTYLSSKLYDKINKNNLQNMSFSLLDLKGE